MCGRYALGVRMAFVQQRLRDRGMPVNDAPDDDEVRETYNFAPGYNGAVYRADDASYHDERTEEQETTENPEQQPAQTDSVQTKNPKYKLQSMKWGLIPFWTKRQPDYGTLMRTINCRDDSLIDDRGMWTSMKRKKRCVVVCQGFYEWLKKGPGGKEKIPHYTKRKDGDLMCFAGLWDCVSYEGKVANYVDGSDEKLYTYTIITTSSNPYLKFLHDRMPVILEPGSEEMKRWLDPNRTTWSKELQSILKPYEGDLESYAVAKEVGKVGNNSPDFLVPISSKENKNNIANFFANAKKEKGEPQIKEEKEEANAPEKTTDGREHKIIKEEDEKRATKDNEWSEDNAPMPAPGVKRKRPPEEPAEVRGDDSKQQKTETPTTPSPKKSSKPASASKSPAVSSGKKTRSATHNHTPLRKAEKDSGAKSQKITDFFQR